ncbi:MAG TPA: hypothetical protein VMT20_09780 [Terriglobia bacterium]|nr:hypothetical protein [Terriglobia bacterium]
MASIEKNVTDEVREANRANSAASTGPVTEAGKKQSSLNAFKHGRYAKRLDPVKRLLEDLSQEEEAEREALCADAIERYQPPDTFAEQQAEELAHLQFELLRLEGVKQAIWQRERELLELEQRRRALRLKEEGVKARSNEIYDCGLVSQPDSPGKFREMLRILESLVHGEQDQNIKDVRTCLYQLYGDSKRAWRGVRLRWAVNRVEKAESDEEGERASRQFDREAEQEIELVREELAICELEQGPLSQAGQAARLLEVMSSRKWSWMRQQENFLMRSIDRKLRVLIDLRREHDAAERRAATQPLSGKRSGDGSPPQNATGNGDAGYVQMPEQVESAQGSAGPEDAKPAVPQPNHPVGSASPKNISEKSEPNKGTKPLSDLFSATAWGAVELEPFELNALSAALACLGKLDLDISAFASPHLLFVN